MRIATLILSAALVATSMPQVSHAGQFSNKKFVYRAEGKRLVEVLQDFAASQGMPIVIDPGVEGTVNANFNARAEAVLNTLSRTFGTLWYNDGTTLFVYPSRAMQSRVFRMRGYGREQVRQMLAALGLGDPRFPLRFDEAQQTLLAYGPPRHIELVSSVVEQLERDNRDRVGKAIQVFPLRYAFAGDRSLGNSSVPGLVSTLNRLFSGNDAGAGLPSQVRKSVDGVVGKAEKARAAEATFGLKLPGVAAASAEEGDKANALAVAPPVQQNEEEKPFFQADEATNSVIVRGLPDRMKEYEALIKQLDSPQDLVEIEASIIDVRSDEFESLGVEWSLNRNGVTRLSVSPGSPTQGQPGDAAGAVGATNITTLIGGAGQQLLARIRALEGAGKARIISRPRVLGVVNRTASMTDKRVASVRVAGNLDANLFTVEAGTTLQFTPQIVKYEEHREVRLSLSIQDGDFQGAVVDQVPVIKRTEINTEAAVREGESLLVGGIAIESSSQDRSGVPLLSRIPVLGAAFRHDEVQGVRSERLFLITPKIVRVGIPKSTAGDTSPPAQVPSPAHGSQALPQAAQEVPPAAHPAGFPAGVSGNAQPGPALQAPHVSSPSGSGACPAGAAAADCGQAVGP